MQFPPLTALRACVLAALMIPTVALAELTDLATPKDRVVLTVTGAVSQTNGDGMAQFDMEMLKALPATEFSTATIWTKGTLTFTGVSLKALMEHVGADGGALRGYAINDYSVDIPADDATADSAIIAYAVDGSAMSVRDKGPLWIVYPYDSSSSFRTEVVYSRSIWQLNRIEVLE